jgi:acyl-CoA synthetase (AMP-forming)/AMP-acid ligase II
MPEVVRRAATLFGDADSVVLPDRRMSFRSVESASRRLAQDLLDGGVTKGTRVGIHMASGPEWVATFVAVTRIGALAMPFSTLYRPAELRTAMRVGDVSLLMSSPTILGKDHEAFLEDAVPGLSKSAQGGMRIPDIPYLRSIWLLGGGTRGWADRFDLLVDDEVDPAASPGWALLEAVEAEVMPSDPMLVVFTSGTTADPKAVVHSQGSLIRKMSAEANAGLNAMFGGRVLCLMPFFWVGGMQEVLAALQSGAALITLERPDPSAALHLAKRERVTSIKETILARRSLFEGVQLDSAIPTVRPLPARTWDGGPSSRGDIAFGIGMTETFGLWTNVEGMESRIVDPDTGRPVGDGEIGEFWVRGYALMQGLYKHEREEVFTPDGFFPTGDLGYAESGKFYFTSRLKDLIKTKGANVAPAEVEAVLNKHPAVRSSFVAGLPHDAYGEEVVAMVVPDESQLIDVDALLSQCRSLLSSYKVPTMIEVLSEDQVPRLPSGKIDRRTLINMLAQAREEASTR